MSKPKQNIVIFILQFQTMDLFSGECRARSACTYAQSDLALHYPLVYHQFLSTKPVPKQALVFIVFSKCLLKTLQEKEKLLVTSNFSFSHSVFYPFGEFSAIFIKFRVGVCKLFQFGRVLNFIAWERVNGKVIEICLYNSQ